MIARQTRASAQRVEDTSARRDDSGPWEEKAGVVVISSFSCGLGGRGVLLHGAWSSVAIAGRPLGGSMGLICGRLSVSRKGALRSILCAGASFDAPISTELYL